MSDYDKTNRTLNTRSAFDYTWGQFQMRMDDSEDAGAMPSETEGEARNQNWTQVDITKWSQCTIVDAEEVGCDECDVHFYHNFLLESDKIFAPIEDDVQAITVNIIIDIHLFYTGFYQIYLYII